MTVSEWFGNADLGALYAAGMGILVFLVTCFGFFKLFRQRRRTRRLIAEQEAKAADEEGRLERTVLAYREDDEGDLFGVRALEKGFTGGVYQSRPNTPQVSRTASLVIPKKVRIPYGKPNLSRSTIALDLGGTPASGSAEQGSLARKNGREGFDRSGSTSIAGSSAETSRSNTPEESYSRSCSSVKHNHTPSGSSLDYDMVEANRNLDGSSGSTPPNLPLPARPENQFMIKIQKPEYPSPAVSRPTSLMMLPGKIDNGANPNGGLGINQDFDRTRASTASIGDVYDSYYSHRTTQIPSEGVLDHTILPTEDESVRYPTVPRAH